MPARSSARRLIVASLILATTPLALRAQTAPKPDREDVLKLDDLTVTESRLNSPTTLTVGKGLQELRKIPQSGSTITRQRLDEQNLTSLPDVLKFTPGITVQRFDGAGLFNNYYARGYIVDSIQLDGLPFGNTGNVTEFDTALYDRVEILRGPAGLFQGAGEPGAALNLARKRARSANFLRTAASFGSWNAWRVEADANLKLTDSGNLRGRAVAVMDDRNSFLDVVGTKRTAAYGTLEWDLAPSTTFSVGAARQEINSVVDQGLPAYADGTLLDVAPSTFIGANWNQLSTDATDVFAEFEHRLPGGGFVKVASRFLDRLMLYKVARANSAVAANGNVSMQTGIFSPDRDAWSHDAYLSLPFTTGSRTHNFILGADRREQDEVSKQTAFANTTTQNVFNPDHNLPEPVWAYTGVSETVVRQSGLYSQARLALTDSLTAVAGGRFTWWKSRSRNLLTNAVTAEFEARGEFTPFAAVLFDVTKHVTAYASYGEIFQPQNARRSSGEQLPPRTGTQVEAGLKSGWFDDRLTAQAAVFRIQDQNRSLTDPDNPLFSIPAGEVRSEGFEIEIGGYVVPAWSVSAAYTFNETEYVTAPASQQGTVFAPFTPRHTTKLWTRYEFSTDSLKGLSVGGGVRTFSSFYSQSGTVRFVGDGQVIANLQLGYRFSKRWDANLTVENLFDEIYYEKVSGTTRQNFYGAPRNATLRFSTTF